MQKITEVFSEAEIRMCLDSLYKGKVWTVKKIAKFIRRSRRYADSNNHREWRRLNENIGLLNERLGWHITVQGYLEDQIRAAEECQKAEDVAERKRLQKDFSDSNTGIQSRVDPTERLSNEPSS